MGVALVMFGSVMGVLFTATGAALAHSGLERSDPASGGMVAPGRTALTLWFAEPIDAASSFVLQPGRPGGVPLRTTSTVDASGTVVHVSTPPLERGSYELVYRVISVGDGHRTSGTVVFGAGTRPSAAAGAQSPSDPVGVVIRWLDLTGVVVAIGVVTAARRCLRAVAGSRDAPSYAVLTGIRRRAVVVGAAAVSTAVVAGAVTPLLRARTEGTSADWAAATGTLLTTSSWGLLWAAREVALIVAAVALWMLRSAPDRLVTIPDAGGAGLPVVPDRERTAPGEAGTSHPSHVAAVAIGALVATAVLDGMSGHASTMANGATVAALAAAGHLIAAGVWSGGLTALVLAARPAMRARGGRRRLLGPVWRAFGPVAAAASVVLVATGVYAAGLHVDDVDGVTSTAYGQAVLGKSVLLAVALGFAAYNTLAVRPRLAQRVRATVTSLRPGSSPRVEVRPRWLVRRRLATTVALEAAVLGLALALAAALTSMPTAHESAAADRVTPAHTTVVSGLFVTLETSPEGSGLRFVVRARSVVRPEPGPVTGADVTVIDEAALAGGPAQPTSRTTLRAVEPGHYEALGPAPAGRWTALVTVHRDRAPDTVARIGGLEPVEQADTSALRTPASIVAALLLTAPVVLVVARRSRLRGRAWLLTRPTSTRVADPAHVDGSPRGAMHSAAPAGSCDSPTPAMAGEERSDLEGVRL